MKNTVGRSIPARLFSVCVVIMTVHTFITAQQSAPFEKERVILQNGRLIRSADTVQHSIRKKHSKIPDTFTAKRTESASADFRFVPGPEGATVRNIVSSKNGWMFLATDAGVYRSSDNGSHWEINLFPNQHFNFIEPITVLAANVIAAEGSNSTYLSRDNGATWSDYLPAYHGMVVDSNGTIYAAGHDNGVYRSLDTAKSWQPFSLSGKILHKVMVDNDGSFICAGDSGIYYSSDHGSTWSFRPRIIQYPSEIVNDRQGHLFSILNSTVYRSDDFGSTWIKLIGPNADQTGYAYRMFVGNDNRLYVIYNQAIHTALTTSTAFSIIPFTGEWPLCVGFDTNGALLAGNFEGVYRRDTVNGIWTELNKGLHSLRINSIRHSASGTLFVMSLGRCFRSMDGGTTWTEVVFGSPNTYNSYDPLFTSAAGPILISAWSNGVAGTLRSIDDGLTWSFAAFPGTSSYATAFCEGKNGALFAGTNSGSVYRSTNGGASWAKVYNGTAGSSVDAIAVDSAGFIFGVKDSTLLRSVDGLNWFTSRLPGTSYNNYTSMAIERGGRIYICSPWNGTLLSTDQGNTWSKEHASLSGEYIICLAADDSGNVFAGSYSGVLRLSDSIQQWENFSDGFPETFVMSLTVSPDGYVYSGTQDYGMFVTGSPVRARDRDVPILFGPPPLPPGQFAGSYDLFQNYPNPFNGSTTIWYDVAGNSAADITISVYDVLGRRVASLVSQPKREGRYSVTWTPENAAGGIYFCMLMVRDGSRTYSKSIKVLYIR